MTTLLIIIGVLMIALVYFILKARQYKRLLGDTSYQVYNSTEMISFAQFVSIQEVDESDLYLWLNEWRKNIYIYDHSIFPETIEGRKVRFSDN